VVSDDSVPAPHALAMSAAVTTEIAIFSFFIFLLRNP
jgi:hypothetical protein